MSSFMLLSNFTLLFYKLSFMPKLKKRSGMYRYIINIGNIIKDSDFNMNKKVLYNLYLLQQTKSL